MYKEKFRSFIHSRKGLTYLLSNYDKKTEVLEAIKDAYIKLR